MSSSVVAVASAKGGVGKTTTSVNLAALLSAAGHDVVVVEVNVGMTNLLDFVHLDVDDGDDRTLDDVLAGDATIDDATYGTPVGFDVVLSGTDPDSHVGPEALGDVLDGIRDEYDVVILDTAPGVSHETLLPLGLADAIVLVSTPRVASVRDAGKTKELADRVGGSVVGIVFAQSGTGSAPPVEVLADFLGVPLLGHVPDDEAVAVSQDTGLPVVNYRPESPAATAYRDVAARLLEVIDVPPVEE